VSFHDRLMQIYKYLMVLDTAKRNLALMTLFLMGKGVYRWGKKGKI